MSSDIDIESPPSTPPKTANPPCMFTVEQFQPAAPSRRTDSDIPTAYEYIVRPSAIWDSLARFKQVAISESTYLIHETVTITRYDLPTSPLWTAHILEIRGSKTLSQVFIRVFWFYQPSQLPDALRHAYHSRRELLASNSMAVVDAMAIVDSTRVSHWHEEHKSVPAEGLFWRQTYDVQAQALSPLHTPCPAPCPLPHNPDEPLIRCPLPGCNARIHKSCIIDSTLTRVKAEGVQPKNLETKSDGSKFVEPKSVKPKGKGVTSKSISPKPISPKSISPNPPTAHSSASPAPSIPNQDPSIEKASTKTSSMQKSSTTKANASQKISSIVAEWVSEPSDGDSQYGVLIKEGGSVEQGGRIWVEDALCLGCGGVMR